MTGKRGSCATFNGSVISKDLRILIIVFTAFLGLGGANKRALIVDLAS
jgi:hypothetical protein